MVPNMSEATFGIIRHALTFAGGLAVMYGYLDAAKVGPDVTLACNVIGGAATLLGVIGSIINKFRHKQAIVAATPK